MPADDRETERDAERDMSASAYPYARFWRCALQVNPVGYAKAYRGQDHGLSADEYVAALLSECQAQDIKLVGLADHGSVADVDAMRSYLTPHGIVVLPGFEVCTSEKIHWVCLFPESTTSDELKMKLGAFEPDPTDRAAPCQMSGRELLTKIDGWNAVCFAAHATNDSGLLKKKVQQLWRNPRLRAVQIPARVADLPQEYRQIAANTDPAYRRDRPIAFINAMDVVRPEDLRDPRASCYVKMTRPGFDALVTAFKDPESRVKLAGDADEQHYSCIERMQIDGGYLGGVDVTLSPHLNTLIGGRGTGKSTLIECLRYALGLEHRTVDARRQGDSIIKENLGEAHGRVEVTLRSHAQQMLRYRVVRRYGEPLRVIDQNGDVSALTVSDLLPSIEVYGQNEIYDLAKDANALVRVLDRYLPDRKRHTEQVTLIQRKLRTNAERLQTAEEQREELDKQLQRLPSLEEQARQFDSIGLSEKLKVVPLLAREKLLPQRFRDEIERVAIALENVRDSLPDTTFLSDAAIDDLPHVEVVRRVRVLLNELRQHVAGAVANAEVAIAPATAAINAAIVDLDAARGRSEAAMEREFASLPAMAGKDGSAVGRTYQALQRDIETIRPLQARMGTIDALLKTLRQERDNALSELSDLRSARTQVLEREVKRLNRQLAGKLRLKVLPNANRQPLKDMLSKLPGIGEKGLAWIDSAPGLTIAALADACRSGAPALLARGWGVTPARAETLCKMARAELLALETIDLEDRVTLELNVSATDETFKPLERLSVGQQCTAILHLLLLDNRDPLVMDQPEDNLDNAFIADRIVQELRRAKTSRQFIFATHNANIPVFGDAEWIGVFEADSERGQIPPENQGSIDLPRVRDEAARILDGGREAFMQRQQKYGY